MPKTTMRKYLRKSGKKKSDTGISWRLLHKRALSRAEELEDPRVRDLKHWASNPEKALRRLSIISEVDLEREFPGS